MIIAVTVDEIMNVGHFVMPRIKIFDAPNVWL